MALGIFLLHNYPYNNHFSFGGDTKAHLRHRQMNNESVKRCREKKKQEHEALRAGYEKQEEDLKKAKIEIGILKATIKKLQAAVHAPAPANDDANKNLVRTNNSRYNNDAAHTLLYSSH